MESSPIRTDFAPFIDVLAAFAQNTEATSSNDRLRVQEAAKKCFENLEKLSSEQREAFYQSLHTISTKPREGKSWLKDWSLIFTYRAPSTQVLKSRIDAMKRKIPERYKSNAGMLAEDLAALSQRTKKQQPDPEFAKLIKGYLTPKEENYNIVFQDSDRTKKILHGNTIKKSYLGKTWLGTALRKGDIAHITFLIRQGAPVNQRSHGCLPLTIALEKGQREAFTALLKAGADPLKCIHNAEEGDRFVADLLKLFDEESLKTLLDTPTGRTLFNTLLQSKNITAESISKLLPSVNLGEIPENQQSSLINAIQSGDDEKIELILGNLTAYITTSQKIPVTPNEVEQLPDKHLQKFVEDVLCKSSNLIEPQKAFLLAGGERLWRYTFPRFVQDSFFRTIDNARLMTLLTLKNQAGDSFLKVALQEQGQITHLVEKLAQIEPPVSEQVAKVLIEDGERLWPYCFHIMTQEPCKKLLLDRPQKLKQILFLEEQNLLEETDQCTFMQCVADQSPESFDQLIDKLSEQDLRQVLTKTDRQGLNVLHYASAMGRPSCLNKLRDKDPQLFLELLVQPSHLGNTPLRMALKAENSEVWSVFLREFLQDFLKPYGGLPELMVSISPITVDEKICDWIKATITEDNIRHMADIAVIFSIPKSYLLKIPLMEKILTDETAFQECFKDFPDSVKASFEADKLK